MNEATNDVNIQINIPNAEIINGNNIVDPPLLYNNLLSYEAIMTIHAQVDSANEPNKSAPIPAISPTLSPTLSAIVAGFFGLSSAKFSSNLPTKSAPTSAAFVYIPPPTLPNNATVEPPNPYPAIHS